MSWELVRPDFGLFWIFAAIKVAFLIGLVVVIVALLRSKGRSAATPSSTHALTVLEERYARGEISRDEFVERRSVLRGEEPLA